MITLKRTIYSYILAELWPNFAVCLSGAVFIILATRMLSITEMIVAQGVGAAQMGRMVAYLLPEVINFALPAASLMAVVLGFLRFSADNEIIALKASGISVYQMLPPVALLSALGLGLGLWVSLTAIPWGNRAFKDLVIELAQSKADMGIKERVFTEPFEGVVFYVRSVAPRSGVMREVFVVDRRDPLRTTTVVADSARMLKHPQQPAITLHFEDGTIFVLEKEPPSERTIRFTSYDLNVDMTKIMASVGSRRRKPRDLTVPELIERMRSTPPGTGKYYKTILELGDRFTIPLAVFLMGMIGVPLGAQLQARGRSLGIGISLAVFLLYYLCMSAVKSVGETGALHPVVGVWIPDLFLLAAGVYLLHRVAAERRILWLPKSLRGRKPAEPEPGA